MTGLGRILRCAGMMVLLTAVLMTPPDGARASDPAGVIYSATRNDSGFTELASEGVTRYQDAVSTPVRERVVSDYEEALEAVETFAAFGLGHVVAVGFIPSRATAEVAPRFPDTKFTLIDGDAAGDNIRTIRFREEEVGYLAGVAAALASKTGSIGFVGGIPIPPVERFGCGYVAGATVTRPDVRVHAAYIGDSVAAFRDVVRGRSLGLRMIDAHEADILFAAAGIAGKGTLEAASLRGVLGIGVDTNQNALFPGSVLTSAIKRVDEAVFRALIDHDRGDWRPGTTEFGLAERALGLAVDRHNADLIAPHLPTISVVEASLTERFPNAASQNARCTLPLLAAE